jgi:hypothetical protein
LYKATSQPSSQVFDDIVIAIFFIITITTAAAEAESSRASFVIHSF